MKTLVRTLCHNLSLPAAMIIALGFNPEASADLQCQVHKAQRPTTVETLEQKILSDQTESGSIFTSLEAAVIAASDYFNPLSIIEDREYLGAILRHRQRPKHFIYNVAAGQAGADQIIAHLPVPKEYEIVAFWHTHGSAHWSRRYFSDTDTRLVGQWQLPLYLADHLGALRVFKPEAHTLSGFKARKLGLGYRHGYAKGETVKHPSTGKRIRVATRMESLEQQMIAAAEVPVCAEQEDSSSAPNTEST